MNWKAVAQWALGAMGGVILFMQAMILNNIASLASSQEKLTDRIAAVDSRVSMVDSRVSTIEGKLSTFPQINSR